MLRLTEKLIQIHGQHESNYSEEIVDLPNSICNFIRKILNTRQGSVLINPNFGIPALDVSLGLVSEEDKIEFLSFINLQVKLAEPRVTNVKSILIKDNNVAVIMAFNLIVETLSLQTIAMVARLQSDSTIDVELS